MEYLQKDGNNLNKTLIYSIIFILLLSSVYAPKPAPEVSGNLEGLQIRTLNLPYHTVNQVKNFKIHVFNVSNGYPITKGITCYLHLYNTSYNHIAEVETSTVAHQYDYELSVGVGNFSKIGYYPYILQCNNTVEGGFYADSLDVTNYGGAFSEDLNPLIVIILLPLLFAFILMFGAAFMGAEHPALKIFIYLLIPILFFSSMHFGMIAVSQLYNLPILQDTIGDTTYWTGIIAGVIITYFIIYLIYKAFRNAAQDKEDEINY